MDWQSVSYSVAVLFACLALWNWTALARGRSSASRTLRGVNPGFDSSERAAVEEIDRLQKKIAALCQKVALVEEHAGEYFYVLHDSGWMKVIELLEQLELVNADITRWVQADSFDNALQLSRYLATEGVPWTESLTKLSSTDLRPLADWGKTVDEIILATACALGAAAESTKRLGIDRGRKQKPTLLAVDEIMKLLERRRDEKSNLKEW